MLVDGDAVPLFEGTASETRADREIDDTPEWDVILMLLRVGINEADLAGVDETAGLFEIVFDAASDDETHGDALFVVVTVEIAVRAAVNDESIDDVPRIGEAEDTRDSLDSDDRDGNSEKLARTVIDTRDEGEFLSESVPAVDGVEPTLADASAEDVRERTGLTDALGVSRLLTGADNEFALKRVLDGELDE